MSAAVAIVIFYGLLALAVVVLRGDLADWPRGVDRGLALVICLGAVAWLLQSWKPQQPLAGPAEGGRSRPRSMWWWWAGLAGLAAVVFLAVLPPLSVVLARPFSVERSAPGRDSPGANPPADAEGELVRVDAAGVGSGAGAGPGLSAELVEVLPSRWERAWRFWREWLSSRPPWMVAVLLGALLAAGWLLWRWSRRGRRLPGQGGESEPVPWHADPLAPAYVREFRRLCEHLGHPPRPGDTWRDLLARLESAPATPAPLESVAAYHYRVRYEGVAADPSAEREFVHLIRAVRKAANGPPTTEKAKAA